uniref:Putative secreted protein n=1 Tax=Ixodes ricinus TaxID=34613 RepID=A0A6B0U5J2_IXORI
MGPCMGPCWDWGAIIMLPTCISLGCCMARGLSPPGGCGAPPSMPWAPWVAIERRAIMGSWGVPCGGPPGGTPITVPLGARPGWGAFLEYVSRLSSVGS